MWGGYGQLPRREPRRECENEAVRMRGEWGAAFHGQVNEMITKGNGLGPS